MDHPGRHAAGAAVGHRYRRGRGDELVQGGRQVRRGRVPEVRCGGLGGVDDLEIGHVANYRSENAWEARPRHPQFSASQRVVGFTCPGIWLQRSALGSAVAAADDALGRLADGPLIARWLLRSGVGSGPAAGGFFPVRAVAAEAVEPFAVVGVFGAAFGAALGVFVVPAAVVVLRLSRLGAAVPSAPRARWLTALVIVRRVDSWGHGWHTGHVHSEVSANKGPMITSRGPNCSG